MSASDDQKSPGESKKTTEGKKRTAAGRSATKSGDRPKPPVTIDLEAEPAGSEESRPSTPIVSGDGVKPSEPAASTPVSGDRPDEDTPFSFDSQDKGASESEPLAGDLPPPVVPPPSASDTGGRSGRYGVVSLVVAAVIGGIIATVLGIAYHASGVVPTRSETVAQEALQKIDSLTGDLDGLDKRIAAVEAAAPSGGANVGALTDQIARLESLANANRDRIAQLAEAAPADSQSALSQALDTLETRVRQLEAAGETDGSSAVSDLSQSVLALRQSLSDLSDRVDALTDRPDPGVETKNAARAVAIALIQQASQRGGAFSGDLAMLKALGTDNADVDALEPLAAKDTPSLAALQDEFPEVADSILESAANSESGNGFIDQLASIGGDLITVRPTAPIDGDSVQAIVSRMQDAVVKGDLTTALSERNGLPEAGQTASAAWAMQASDRATIDTLVDKLALSLTVAGN